jgi:MFS family permease
MKLDLHISDLWKLATARGISAFGDQVAITALLLRVHDSGGGASGVTLLLVASALPAAGLAPVGGRLADTLDSRLVTTAAAITEAVVCVALAATSSVPATLLLVLVLQSADALAAPAWSAWVPHIAGRAGTPRALGLTQATVTAASLAGPAVGGLLTGIAGARLPLLVDAATFALLAVGAATISSRRRRASAGVEIRQPQLGDGFRVLRRDPLLRPVTLTLLCYILVGEAINVVEIFLIRDTLHGSATAYGAIGSVTVAASIVGSLVGGRLGRRPRLLPTIVVTAAIQALGVIAAGVAPSIGVLMLAWIVVGSANGALNTAVPAMFFRRLPEELHGRVMGALNGLGRTVSLFALGLGDVALMSVGSRASFILSGGLALAVLSNLAIRVGPLKQEEARELPIDLARKHHGTRAAGTHGCA